MSTCRADANGLILKASVTKSTKLLILGSTKGTAETSKQKAARKHGTRITTEAEIDELEHMVRQAA
jgi:NAD-dependent DNA ligase